VPVSGIIYLGDIGMLLTMPSLKYTRAILDAINSGELANVEYETYHTFNLHVPKTCTGVPDEMLNPKKSWTGSTDFKEEVTKLGSLFVDNFKKYADEATPEVVKAGEPKSVQRIIVLR